MSEWNEIDEDNQPPLDTEVILGWWHKWPRELEGTWACIIGYAGSKRGGWRHGQATHWLPISALPPAPQSPETRSCDGTDVK